MLPELTIKAIGLGIALSVLLGAANAYLGLKAGMTVSASIPAAVLSMALLRLFKRSNILENNQVQTAASAGESLAAGVIFTMPVLVIMGAWQSFNYMQTVLIAATGGVLGVLFTVPLRRALIVEPKLAFPEGVATAQVLKAGDSDGGGVRSIAWGAAAGALFKLGESGLGVWVGSVEAAGRVGRGVAYVGISASPALMAVGYIVGLNIGSLVFIGGALNWFIAIPIVAAVEGLPPKDSLVAATRDIWMGTTRHIGVGAMVVGGLWALIRVCPLLLSGLGARRATGAADAERASAPQRDLPAPWVAVLMLACVVPLCLLLHGITRNITVALVLAGVIVVAGALFSAVASYMAGLVGSSNNPVSGMTIATLLGTSFLLVALHVDGATGPVAAILIGAVICCAAAIGGDNMQDLKTGQLVGATPWKQQVMQLIGVVTAALVMAPILQLLHARYEIGSAALPAPQATLMKSITEGVFERNLPWTMLIVGAAVAVAVIVIDVLLERRKARFRVPVLAVAVGIYLPLTLVSAIFLGGVVAAVAKRLHRGSKPGSRGILLASGLITGEALLGILLAVPVLFHEGKDPLRIVKEGMAPVWPALAWLAALALAFVFMGRAGGDER